MSDDSKAHRRELIREYKRTPKEMGVYAIRNKTNGKCFIGANRDLRARINRHIMCLKTGSETIRELQADWNALGEDAFEFEVLDLLEPSDKPGYDPGEDLEVLESLWLEKLMPWGEQGYNRQKG